MVTVHSGKSIIGPTQLKMKFITQALLYTALTLNFTEIHLIIEIKMCVLIKDTHTQYLQNIYFTQSRWIMHKEPYETCSQ
jgi:hypothetical protein